MNPSGAERFKPETVAETPPPSSLGNLNAENKALKEQLDTVTQKLAVAEKQIADSERDRPNDDPLRQELETVRGRLKEEIGNYGELAISTKQLTRELNKVRSQLEAERADRQQLQTELAELQKRLDAAEQNPDSANTQQPATELGLPDAADLLNQLKGHRKKSKVELADVTAILEFLERRTNEKLSGQNN